MRDRKSFYIASRLMFGNGVDAHGTLVMNPP